MDFSGGEDEEPYADDEEVGNLYSGDDDEVADSNDEDYEYCCPAEDDSNSLYKIKSYTVLSEADVKHRQEKMIAELADTLSLSTSESSVILSHYYWNVSQVHDRWFSHEAQVRKTVGLVDQPSVDADTASQLTCTICFEVYSRDDMASVACGHLFCRDCWQGYIATSVGDGPGCLTLRCPAPSCAAAVTPNTVEELAPEEIMLKYARYLVRSYVEGNKNAKWCPAPGCDYAVAFVAGSDDGYDVNCNCGHSFCWNCAEDAHRPVDCETVAKWMLKNSVESENTNWILENSKPCPKCKRSIEKNHGCMHMTCRAPCKYEFCWLCLGPWTKHGGSFYVCNRYEEAKQKGKLDEEEDRRQRAKNSVDRYTHYYERWASNLSSMRRAKADLNQMRAEKVDELRNKYCSTASDVKFVIEAWEQIVECRRVLTWTYPYGYYLPHYEHGKMRFFENLQGDAEAALERLHKCAEIDLQAYFEAETTTTAAGSTLQEFIQFRTKLAGLTSVTRSYFDNLVRALETGLQEVESKRRKNQRKSKGRGDCALAEPSDNAGCGDEYKS